MRLVAVGRTAGAFVSVSWVVRPQDVWTEWGRITISGARGLVTLQDVGAKLADAAQAEGAGGVRTGACRESRGGICRGGPAYICQLLMPSPSLIR